MAGILDILGGPVSALLGGVKALIGQKLTNDADKIEVAAKLGEMQIALQEAVLNADLAFAQAQRDVLVADSKSESTLTRMWRPIVFLTIMALIVYIAVFVSAFKLPAPDFSVVPDRMWTMLTYGLTGGVVGRSVEKVAPAVIAAVRGK